MGSGKLLSRAISKHGLENFRKDILGFFDTEIEALDAERQLVTEEFVSRDDTYNLTLGGGGGWHHVNMNQNHVEQKDMRCQIARQFRWLTDEQHLVASAVMKQLHIDGKIPHIVRTGQKHTPATRQKISTSNMRHVRQVGTQNSQFGTVWIYSEEERVTKKIQHHELNHWIELGWKRGRKIKFDPIV